MRGDVHCRAHRDAELGPRGGGAPTGNLNALKTGEDAHPLDRSAINRLAFLIVTDADCLPDLLAGLARDIQARTQDIDKTLASLSAIFRYLVPSVADARFSAELDALLLQVPPEMRPKVQVAVWKQALRFPPHQKVALLRAVSAQVLARLEKTSTGKTTPGT